MFRILLCAVLASLAFVSPAKADPVPEAALDADYQSCVGGLPADADAQRIAYCSCVRDGMRGWDEQTYEKVAQLAAQSNPQAPPPQLEALAQGCIAKVMR